MSDRIKETFKRRGLTVEAIMKTDIAAAIEPVFDFVSAEDVLPKVLTGYGLLPGVASTSGNTGPWNRPGSSRTVHLADGNTAREEVTAYERPNYFAYRTDNYSFALKYISTGAKGQWWFNADNGLTHIKWSYAFTAKGPFTAVLLSLFVRSQWAGYMRVCLGNTRRHFADAGRPGLM
jgi:hypothetical protein